jgi:hypothetical protein
MKKNIILILVLIFLGIQFIRIDKTNPDLNHELDFNFALDKDPVMNKIIKEACYDCHSNSSIYPWYSNVSPFSWLIRHHIVEGREHMNFSKWLEYSKSEQIELLQESSKKISDEEMPLKLYTVFNSNAKISTRDRYLVAEWLLEIAEDLNELDSIKTQD